MERHSGIALSIAAFSVGGLVLGLSGQHLMKKSTGAGHPRTATSSLVAPGATPKDLSGSTVVSEGSALPGGVEEKERIFRSADAPSDVKQQAAIDLVGTTQDDEEYFEYLRQGAAAAIAFCADMPPPLDASNAMTEDFKVWAATHDLPENEALTEVLMKKPRDVMILANLGDDRAFQVLASGLSSPNTVIRLVSAEGLAYINDPAAIPLIVAAAEGSSDKLGFAKALVRFEDPQASAKVEEWVTDPAVLEGLRDWVAYDKSVRD